MDIRLFWLALGAFAIGAEGFVISSLLPAISADTGVTIAQGGYLAARAYQETPEVQASAWRTNLAFDHLLSGLRQASSQTRSAAAEPPP